MTKEQLKQLLDGDYKTLYEVVKKGERVIKLGDKVMTIADCMKQYDPFLHDVNDPNIRENRKLELEGEEFEDTVTGEIKTTSEYDEQEVNRLQLARQMQIVQTAVFFECGSEIALDYNVENEAKQALFSLVQKVWKDNKLYFETEYIVERRMIETHCAELWYDYEDESYWNGTILQGSIRKPGYLLLCKENGDDIYPIWDQHGGLAGLGRAYTIINPITEVKTLHFDFYSSEKIILGSQEDGGEWQTEPKEGYGFLPIVYHEQKRPEWSNVQPLSDREETNTSNLADTNDYYGDPAMIVEGEAESLPSRGEVAKVIQVKGTDNQRGSVSFAQPDAMVESKKMEFDRLKQEQFDITNTPDISFNTMSQLMSNGTSGIALRLLFMGPQMKGNKSQKRLKEMLTRRNNVIRKMLISFSPEEFKEDMDDVVPNIKIKDALPVDKQEVIGNVTKMVEAKLLSRKTAITMLGEVTDVDAEMKQILEESKQEQELASMSREKNNIEKE